MKVIQLLRKIFVKSPEKTEPSPAQVDPVPPQN
jgi:hypothetical protein